VHQLTKVMSGPIPFGSPIVTAMGGRGATGGHVALVGKAHRSLVFDVGFLPEIAHVAPC